MVRVSGTSAEIESALKQAGVDLAPDEARRVKALIGRDPSVTELYIFDIMWSEHCSYKSSKRILEEHLPTAFIPEKLPYALASLGIHGLNSTSARLYHDASYVETRDAKLCYSFRPCSCFASDKTKP